jgi:hypothetical protein
MIIILDYLFWQYIEMPKRILRAWRNMLAFGFNFFSVGYCFKTIFSPWKKTIWTYPKGLDISGFLEIFFSNLISRILGFIMKVFVIFSSFIYEAFTLIIGASLLIIWLVMPIIAIIGAIIAIQLK